MDSNLRWGRRRGENLVSKLNVEIIIVFLTIITGLWGEHERGSMVGVSSHWKELSLKCVQSSASNLLRWSCARWNIASVSSDVPLSAAALRAEKWAQLEYYQYDQLGSDGFVTWSLSLSLARSSNNRPTMMFHTLTIAQLYTCSTTFHMYHPASTCTGSRNPGSTDCCGIM